jgi:hypothetical protein
MATNKDHRTGLEERIKRIEDGQKDIEARIDGLDSQVATLTDGGLGVGWGYSSGADDHNNVNNNKKNKKRKASMIS